MNRIFVTLILSLTVALAGVLWLNRSADRQIDTLRTQNTELRGERDALSKAAIRAVGRRIADDRVLVARQEKNAAQARKTATVQRAVQTALQRNISWSDVDVPIEVQEALVGPSSPVPEPVPDSLLDGEGGPGAVPGEGEAPGGPVGDLPCARADCQEEWRLG